MENFAAARYDGKMTSAKDIRTRPSHESQYETRTALVKDMVGKENAYNDAKTARLRAQRLEMEALRPPPPPPAPKVRKAVVKKAIKKK